MASEDLPLFDVECTDCGMEKAGSEYPAALEFKNKHEEHTGHSVEWADIDLRGSESKFSRRVVSCSTCNEEWEFNTQEAAIEYRDEHEEFTDHEIDEPLEKIHVDITPEGGVESPRDLKVVIEELEPPEMNTGTPKSAVVSYLASNTDDVDEISNMIEELQKSGEVYESYPGHVKIT